MLRNIFWHSCDFVAPIHRMLHQCGLCECTFKFCSNAVTIDLENIAIGHPAVMEAAVIGVRHPKWDERPLLIVVKKSGAEISRDSMLKFYEGKVARWCVPDDVVFVEQLPHTATGKLSKITLREQFKDYRLPTV